MTFPMVVFTPPKDRQGERWFRYILASIPLLLWVGVGAPACFTASIRSAYAIVGRLILGSFTHAAHPSYQNIYSPMRYWSYECSRLLWWMRTGRAPAPTPLRDPMNPYIIICEALGFYVGILGTILLISKDLLRWLRLFGQFFRFDEWSLCRVRLPSGLAAFSVS
jgi:hypothetical protein